MKRFLTGLISVMFAISMSITAMASGWQGNSQSGWWYGTNADNSAWYSDGWHWIDGNGDGYAECYYFNPNGYITLNGTTPEGYTVNASGQWTVSGVVQTKYVGETQAAVQETQAAKKETASAVQKTDAQTASSVSTEASYIGNCNSKIFHRPSCASVKKMKESNKIGLSSRAEAISDGYTPCKNCKP